MGQRVEKACPRIEKSSRKFRYDEFRRAELLLNRRRETFNMARQARRPPSPRASAPKSSSRLGVVDRKGSVGDASGWPRSRRASGTKRPCRFGRGMSLGVGADLRSLCRREGYPMSRCGPQLSDRFFFAPWRCAIPCRVSTWPKAVGVGRLSGYSLRPSRSAEIASRVSDRDPRGRRSGTAS